MNKDLVPALTQAINAPGTSLAPAALVIARLEFPRLDPQPYFDRLDALGAGATLAVQRGVGGGGHVNRRPGERVERIPVRGNALLRQQ